MKFFLIYRGKFPSDCHARFEDEELCKKEVERLETYRLATNERIDKSPATGHGACFMNVKDNREWSYKEREFPE